MVCRKQKSSQCKYDSVLDGWMKEQCVIVVLDLSVAPRWGCGCMARILSQKWCDGPICHVYWEREYYKRSIKVCTICVILNTVFLIGNVDVSVITLFL